MINNLESSVRANGRAHSQLREIEFSIDAFGYASASILFSQGNTKVLVSVTMQQGLPHFLKGQPVGWLSAEYAMLPCATHQRTNRESSQAQRNARSVEISRLIGRCLRNCIDLSRLRDKTVQIDCDVLQADGGTRVACITAASMALEIAAKRWHDAKITDTNVFTQRITAISVGIVDGALVTDLDYLEDSRADADFNFIITQDNKLIEVQGTAEKTPLGWEQFDAAKALAQESTKQIFDLTAKQLATLDLQAHPRNENIIALLNAGDRNRGSKSPNNAPQAQNNNPKPGPFSLGNRISK